MKEKNMKSNNGTIYYWIGGSCRKDASCIVFTHGMTADHTMFDKQIDFFSKEYKVITWDIPLHGESRPYENFSYTNVAKELNDILKKEEINKVILVGQSMGGYICQEFAIHYPEKVKALIAVDTNPFGHFYYSKWERSVLAKVGNMSSWFTHNVLIKSIAKGSTKTEYAYNNLYSSISKLSKKEIIFIMDMAYGGFLERKETVKFDFPVFLIVGDSDNTGYVKKYNNMWSKHMGYPLREIANAAHNSNVDNYDEFNVIVAEFLSKL